VIVNGEEIATPVVPAQWRSGHLYIPALPIAEKLQADLQFDPADLSITVVDIISGVPYHYEGTTGLVRRDGVVLLGLSPGAPRGSNVADLLLPLPLLTALFALEAEVALEGDQIELTSRVGAPEARVSNLSSVRFQQLQYTGFASHYDRVADGWLGLDARARVERGQLTAATLFQGAQDHSPVLRSATVSYLHSPTRNLWSVGDLRGAGDMGWLIGAGRGVRWSAQRGVGERRLSLAAYRLLRGAKNTGSRVSVPVFDGNALIGQYSVGALPTAPSGLGASIGGGWLGETSEAPPGILAASDLRYFRRQIRLESRFGVFGSADRESGNGYGFEVRPVWLPTKQTRFGARFYQFSRYFRLPRPSFPERNTRQFSLDAGYMPWRWLRATASTSHRSPVEPDSLFRSTSLQNASLSFHTGFSPLSSANVSASQFSDSLSGTTRTMAFDLGGGWRPISWFFSTRRRWEVIQASQYHSAGLGARTPGGHGQLATSWTGSRLESAALSWSFPLLAGDRVAVSLGERWERIPNLDGKQLYGQLRVSMRVAREHSFDLAIEESQHTTVFRLGFNGSFLFPDVASSPVTGLGDLRYLGSGTVGGRVYVDKNLNRRFDDPDRPLDGVTILLDGGRYRTTSGSDGQFEFASVRIGPHALKIAGETVRADLSLLEPQSIEFEVPANKRVDVDFRAAPNRAVEGMVFRDDNGNGERDAGEPGLPNVRVYVAGGRDAISYYDGTYRIGDLPPGRRLILLDETSLGDGFLPREPIEIYLPTDEDLRGIDIAVTTQGRPVIRNRFGD
jgi:hypothetical protein